MNRNVTRSVSVVVSLVAGMLLVGCGMAVVSEPPGETNYFRMYFEETAIAPGFPPFTTSVAGQLIAANWVRDDIYPVFGSVEAFTRRTDIEGYTWSPGHTRLPAIWKFLAVLGACHNEEVQPGPVLVWHNSLVTLTCVVPVDPPFAYGYLTDGTPVYTGGMDKLMPNDVLYAWEWRQSADGRMRLTYQGDGNLVLYDNNSPVWASNTAGISSERLVMQGDGNLVIYKSNNVPIWHTHTNGYDGAIVVVQPNRCALMYYGDPTNVFIPWGTGTCE